MGVNVVGPSQLAGHTTEEGQRVGTQLTVEDVSVILESLQYSKLNIGKHDKQSSPEFKRSQLERIEKTAQKVRALRKELETAATNLSAPTTPGKK
jgi:hypothetical protein